MKENLPEEVLQYSKELENHMKLFADNLKNKNFDKLKEDEDGFRDAMNALLNFYYIKFQNDESVNDLKEMLVQTLTRLHLIRTTLETNPPYEEAKKHLECFGIVI